MVDPSSVTELLEQYPHRKRQIETLRQLFGSLTDVPPPCIFVYGHAGTGKYLIVSSLLKFLKVSHVVLNCVECYNPRILFEMILNGISKVMPSKENDYKGFAACENANDFVRMLKRAIIENGNNSESVYIVLKKADRLLNLPSYVLPLLLRLQEFVQMKICVMLLSELIWEKFRISSGLLEPILLHFPQYTKDELHEILLMEKPADYSLQFYSNYIQVILSTFYMVYRSYVDIRYLVKLHFKKYLEPVLNGEAKETDSKILWRHIKPHLRKCLYTSQVEEFAMSRHQMQSVSTQIQLHYKHSNIELPSYAKYLVIAAYLASYNPAKMDSRFFVKNQGKTKKKVQKNKVKHKHKVSNHLLGPKAFPLGRLLAIFYSIIEEKVSRNDVFLQISTLLSLNLLALVGKQDIITSPKYKCLASLVLVKSIGRSLNMDVTKYLYDFL